METKEHEETEVNSSLWDGRDWGEQRRGGGL